MSVRLPQYFNYAKKLKKDYCSKRLMVSEIKDANSSYTKKRGCSVES